MRYVRLWYACFRNCLGREMEYRANFLSAWVIDIIWYALNLLFFDAIFLHVEGIADWKRYEVYVFMGAVYILDALATGVIFENAIRLPRAVNKGELDFILLKPVNPQFLASVRYIKLSSLSNVIFGIPVLIYGLAMLGITPSVADVALFIVMLINGLIMTYATCFMFQTLSFWLLASQGFEYGYYQLMYNFIMKPDSIYRGAVRFVLTYILPATVIASFPARALMDKDVERSMIVWSFAGAALLLWLSTRLFKLGLRRYESASS